MNRGLCLIGILSSLCAGQGFEFGAAYHLEAVAGSGGWGDHGPAIRAEIGAIQGLAMDRSGNLYLSDTDHHRICKVDPSGMIATVAGTGEAGFSGDGGPAFAARLNLPYGIAVDAAGVLYIADLGNQRVRRVTPDGTITTVAGTGEPSSTGDGGPATQAALHTPRNVTVDVSGNLYIAEFEGHRIRRVAPNGIISTFAGSGASGFGGDGGLAVNAQLSYPAGLAFDAGGRLYIADSQNNRIRRVANGVITTVLGSTPATALATPIAVAIDLAGNLYVADSGFAVRSYTAGGAWVNFAGSAAQGFAGDGGPAAQAQLNQPRDLVAAPAAIYIADGLRVRRVDSNGQITTIAGDGFLQAIGDGGPSSAAILDQPLAVALDRMGNLFLADYGEQRIRQIQASGRIVTLAGTGTPGGAGDGGPAATAQLRAPNGVAADPYGNIAIADTGNHRIRWVGASGRISTLVGGGSNGSGQGPLPPFQVQLRSPRGVCFDRFGTLFITDTGNHRVLRYGPNTMVETVAGTGVPGGGGDGGPARSAQLYEPSACALDSAGNLFLADTLNHRIRKITPDGAISTVAGTGEAGYSGDAGPAVAAQLSQPRGIAVNDNGEIFIADTGNHSIRLVTADGMIHTIAGQGAPGYAGDGAAAASALLNAPSGLVLDGAGDLYIADTGNRRIRRLVPDVNSPSTNPAPLLSASSAAGQPLTAVAPGELLILSGAGLGPAVGLRASFDPEGMLPNQLGGAEARFDGVSAPLLYAQAGQVSVQAPYEIAGRSKTHVEVFYQGKLAAACDLRVVDAAPTFFPVALNENGTSNSPSAPAASGSIVSFFATGTGLTDGVNRSGQSATPPYAKPQLPVQLLIGAKAAELLYVASAPGLVGTVQINARVPGDWAATGATPVELRVGSSLSSPLTLWVQ
jgi:uncharacterized protein (TIGR03437 family)